MLRGALLTVAVATLAACAPEPSPRQEPTPVPGTPPPVTEEGQVVITEAHAGERFRVALEARPLLRLDSAYVWEEPRTEGDAVEPVRVDYFQDPGFFEWELQPVSPGTTVITSTGVRDCPPGSPCPEEVLEFEVTITVVE